MNINEDFTRRSKIKDIGRHFVTCFVRDIAKNLPKGTSILDAGAGECVYKKYFEHCDYESVDLAVGEEKWNYDHLDYIAPLDKLPIDSESFDAVLCTQVLEHVPNPLECLKEMSRVLKPGGKLFLTVPMAQCEHQIPHDYFRYTSYGLRYLGSQAGFNQMIVVPIGGGMFTRWAYEIPRAMAIFPGTGFKQGKMLWKGIAIAPFRFTILALIRALQFLLLNLERFDHKKNDPFGWQLIARKVRC